GAQLCPRRPALASIAVLRPTRILSGAAFARARVVQRQVLRFAPELLQGHLRGGRAGAFSPRQRARIPRRRYPVGRLSDRAGAAVLCPPGPAPNRRTCTHPRVPPPPDRPGAVTPPSPPPHPT